MNNERLKINLLTRIKTSLGIDTRSDEINMQLKDLKNNQQKIANKIEDTSTIINIVDVILNSIDKIYELAENDVLKGYAEMFSIKVKSYELSIERAKKQNFEISEIVKMQQEQLRIQDECIIKYIDSIIEGVYYSGGNSEKISILIEDIKCNVNRLNLNNLQSNLTSHNDLDIVKKYLLNYKLKLDGTMNNYVDKNSLLRSKIVEVETSHEKYLADYAAELAKQKKKR